MSITQCIDAINECCVDAEFDSIMSMINTYDKYMEMTDENPSINSYGFKIFQEGASEESTGKIGFFGKIKQLVTKLISTVTQSSNSKLNIKRTRNCKIIGNKLKKGSNIDIFADTVFEGDTVDYNKIKKSVQDGLRKEIKRQKLSKAFKPLIKAGVGTILVGGTVYIVKSTGIVEKKVNEYKGKIDKKLEESFIDPIKKQTEEACKKIAATSDKYARQMKEAADKIAQMVSKVIQYIKNLIKKIADKFKIKMMDYKQIEGTNLVCKIDSDTNEFIVSLNLEKFGEFLKQSSEFVTNATKFIGKEIKGGKIVDGERNEKGKLTRGGSIAEAQKKYNNTTIGHVITNNAQDLINKYQSKLQSIFDKSFANTKYKGCDDFADKTDSIKQGLDKMCNVCRELTEKFKASSGMENNKFAQEDDLIHKVLCNILTVSKDMIDSIDAVLGYIDSIGNFITIENLLKKDPTEDDSDKSSTDDILSRLVDDDDWD